MRAEMVQKRIHFESALMDSINLKEIRKKSGFTQEKLAKELGIADSTLAHYESGIRKISLEMFLKLLHVCNLEIKIETKKKI